jgi:hypothetical protein
VCTNSCAWKPGLDDMCLLHDWCVHVPYCMLHCNTPWLFMFAGMGLKG